MTTAYPLAWPEGWPRVPVHRRRSRYALKATFDTARRKLYGELSRLGAKSCVISCNLVLNIDGTHSTRQADVVLPDPGVAVYFSLRDKPMVIATDLYETASANLRSVGLGVEHLRGLERHGGGHMMERAFGGFARLPPPAGANGEEPPPPVPWRALFAVEDPGFAVLGKPDLLAIVEMRYRQQVKLHQNDHERMIVLNAAVADAREELSR